MIQFAKEPLTDALWAEAMPLLEAHWSEVAHFQDIPLNPDRDLYAASEEAGILRCFTARADTTIRSGPLPTFERKLLNVGQVPVIGTYVHPGDLLGYALYFVRPAPHYMGSVQAVQDVLYLAPAHRGRTAYKFVSWCDEQLSTEGVQAVYHHVKASKDFGPMLEHQGYELVDRIYAKRLDGYDPNSVEQRINAVLLAGTIRATWRGELVQVLGARDGRATILVDGYEASNTAPLDELSELTVRDDSWKAPAQHDYDTARFVGVKP